MWFCNQFKYTWKRPKLLPGKGGGGIEKSKIILKNVSPISTKLFFVAILYFFPFLQNLIEEIETVVKHGLLTEDELYWWPLETQSKFMTQLQEVCMVSLIVLLLTLIWHGMVFMKLRISFESLLMGIQTLCVDIKVSAK